MSYTGCSVIHTFAKAFCYSAVSTFTVYANYKLNYISAFTGKITVVFSDLVSGRFEFKFKFFIQGLKSTFYLDTGKVQHLLVVLFMVAEKGHIKTFFKINSFNLRLLKNNINPSKKTVP